MTPAYLRGTAAQHVLFVVALCRFQHHTLPLALVHYLTWSMSGIALHALASTIGGTAGSIVLAVLLTGWALRLDVAAGLLFGLMQGAYAWTTFAIVRAIMPSSSIAAIVLALGAIVVAIATEVASHHVLQGYGPRPPKRALAGVSPRARMSFLPYFVVTFGIFFLTLDLIMRFTRYRSALHTRANELAAEWHADALPTAEARELALHRRAIAELANAA